MSASLPHTSQPERGASRYRAECWGCDWKSSESIRESWAWHERRAHLDAHQDHLAHVTHREV